MVALKPHLAASFLKKRDPAIHAILIYGADAGLVRERSDLLARQVVADLNDPFNFTELTSEALKEQPGRLADEASALSFAGGLRVVRVQGGDAAVLASTKILLGGFENETIKPNALILIEAGNLKKTAALRKLFEAHKAAAALPCYDQSPQDVKEMITQALQQEDLQIEEAALGALLQLLGTDRGIGRSELNKLILYKGPKAVREAAADPMITLEDITACLTDNQEHTIFEIANIVALGRVKELSAALKSAVASGVNPVTILIFLQRLFNRLYTAQGFMADGLPADTAMKKLRPPVFYNEQGMFKQLLRKWNKPRLEMAIKLLLEADFQAKTTGLPQLELVERTALRLAVIAAR
ncbi:MAG: DNA polymerase III subunit delta [bacterium]